MGRLFCKNQNGGRHVQRGTSMLITSIFVGIFVQIVAAQVRFSSITRPGGPSYASGLMGLSNNVSSTVVSSSLVNTASIRLLGDTHGSRPNLQLKPKNLYLQYLCSILIIQASDTETNPGPRKPRWPCGTCGKSVKWTDKGIMCDNYKFWYHTAAIVNMFLLTYMMF